MNMTRINSTKIILGCGLTRQIIRCVGSAVPRLILTQIRRKTVVEGPCTLLIWSRQVAILTIFWLVTDGLYSARTNVRNASSAPRRPVGAWLTAAIVSERLMENSSVIDVSPRTNAAQCRRRPQRRSRWGVSCLNHLIYSLTYFLTF